MNNTIPQVICNSHNNDSQASLANIATIDYSIPINLSNRASVEVVSCNVMINDYENGIRPDLYEARFYPTPVSNPSNTLKPANKVVKQRRTSSRKFAGCSVEKKSKLTQRQKSNVSAEEKSCRLSSIAGNQSSTELIIFCGNQFFNSSYSLFPSSIFSADDDHSLQKPHSTSFIAHLTDSSDGD